LFVIAGHRVFIADALDLAILTEIMEFAFVNLQFRFGLGEEIQGHFRVGVSR
jgi:hypothetical protein